MTDKFFWWLHTGGLAALTLVVVLFPVLPEMQASKHVILLVLAGYWMMYVLLWRVARACGQPAA